MVNTKKPMLFNSILLLLLLFVSACNDSPKQYSSEGPSMGKESNDVIIKTSYDTDAFSIKQPGEDVAAEDEKIRQNSLKEIFYGMGAGGIDLNTTLEQSRRLLSKPEVEVIEGNNIKTYYNSGMYIIWRSEEPQVPQVIWLDNNYQGILRVNGTIGDLKIGKDLSKHYDDQSPRGEKFLEELFNLMEGKSANYSCLNEKRCEILEHPKYFLYNMKKFVVLVTRDRKVVVDMRIIRNERLEDIDPSFDIVSGDFIIDDNNLIRLGDQWSDVRALIGQDGLTNVYLDGFVKNFGSLSFVLSKTKYDRGYINPEETEKVAMTGVNSGFLKPILFDGQYLDLSSFSLVDTPNENVMTLESNVESDNINEVMIKIESVLKKMLQEKHPDQLVLTRISNLQSRNYMKEINLNLMVVDKTTGTGKTIALGYSTIKNKFSFANNDLLVDSELNKIALEDISMGLNGKKVDRFTSLYGISIGDKVVITNIDSARSEASYQLKVQGNTISGRSFYDDTSSLDLIVDESDRAVTFNLEVIQIGDLKSLLFLKKVENEEATHKVVAIFSQRMIGPISNICGNSKLSFIDKERDTESLSKVLEFKKIEIDQEESCPIHIKKKSDGSGFISKIVFPEQRMFIEFSDRELAGLMIYANPKEVK